MVIVYSYAVLITSIMHEFLPELYKYYSVLEAMQYIVLLNHVTGLFFWHIEVGSLLSLGF